MCETEYDLMNVEAWAEIIEDMLARAPADERMKILHLAVQKEQAAIKDRERNGGLRAIDMSKWDPASIPRRQDAISRLKSLVVQVFARDITSDHSPSDAAGILFSYHIAGLGSRYLSDYIDDLPRRAAHGNNAA
jgi:hypothetical protein